MAIAKIWTRRLEAGTQKFGDCPAKYKDEVVRLLKADVESGKITAERYKAITGTAYGRK